jgi:hypothetical protein
MAQHDRKDAQRLKERMRRAQGLYGVAASNVLEHHKQEKKWEPFYETPEDVPSAVLARHAQARAMAEAQWRKQDEEEE